MEQFEFEPVMDRMKTALGLKTDLALAEALGMSAPNFSQRKKAGSLPMEELTRVAIEKKVDLRWLFSGVTVTGVSTGSSLQQSRAHYNHQDASAEFVEIPLYDVRAAAGFGAFIDGERVVESLAFRRDWIDRQFGAQPRDLRLLYIVGDSMEPALSDGDVIMIDRAQNKARADGVYVLRYDDSLVVKKVQRLPGGMIKIFSENPAYEPSTLHGLALEAGEGATVIGRVVWGARKF